MTTITARDAARMTDERREALHAWVRDHDLDPSDVMWLTVNPLWIKAKVMLRNEHGEHYVDPNDPDQVAAETRHIPTRKPLP